MTFSVIPHIVRSAGDKVVGRNVAVDVWYAEERAFLACVRLAEVREGFLSNEAIGNDAVAIERRERTRSSGYVVPRT